MQSFVDFHGQTLMLVHWSILAYTSVLKILKKHHKRTGLQVQEFNLQQLLSQPFCSVEVSKLLTLWCLQAGVCLPKKMCNPKLITSLIWTMSSRSSRSCHSTSPVWVPQSEAHICIRFAAHQRLGAKGGSKGARAGYTTKPGATASLAQHRLARVFASGKADQRSQGGCKGDCCVCCSWECRSG